MKPNAKLAIEAIFLAIIRSNDVARRDVGEIEVDGDVVAFSVRYFGGWKRIPDGYDEEPTDETRRRLDAIVSAAARRFPDVDLTWDSGEKRYVSFIAR